MAFVPLTVPEVTSGEPVKTTTMNKIKENFDDHELRIQANEAGVSSFPSIMLRVNGGYAQLGAVNDILRTTMNMTINIIGVRILIDKAGSAGDTEIDIKRKRGVGAFESILDTLPSANFSDGDNYLSDSGVINLTNAVLEPGDIVRLDITSVQTDAIGMTIRIDWNRTF